jgi:spoIIIJ-associated protein
MNEMTDMTSDHDAGTEPTTHATTHATAQSSLEPAVEPAVDVEDNGPEPLPAEPGQLQGLLEREGDIAADYLEGLLDIADLDGDLDMDVEGERAMVSIVGARLDQLVGERGEVLEALQELTRLAVHRSTGVRSRLMLDIGGWREQRREALARLGRETAERVRSTGQPVALDPMTPFERKAVHDAIGEVGGVRTESEGEEPQRYIVVSPEASSAEAGGSPMAASAEATAGSNGD